jgi:hypothetical protein
MVLIPRPDGSTLERIYNQYCYFSNDQMINEKEFCESQLEKGIEILEVMRNEALEDPPFELFPGPKPAAEYAEDLIADAKRRLSVIKKSLDRDEIELDPSSDIIIPDSRGQTQIQKLILFAKMDELKQLHTFLKNRRFINIGWQKFKRHFEQIERNSDDIFNLDTSAIDNIEKITWYSTIVELSIVFYDFLLEYNWMDNHDFPKNIRNHFNWKDKDNIVDIKPGILENAKTPSARIRSDKEKIKVIKKDLAKFFCI